jgi:hypothetical protein
MVPVERPKTNEKFASREKIRKWKTGIRPSKKLFFSSGFLPKSREAEHYFFFLAKVRPALDGELFMRRI